MESDPLDSKDIEIGVPKQFQQILLEIQQEFNGEGTNFDDLPQVEPNNNLEKQVVEQNHYENFDDQKD